MELEGKISILIGQESTTIEIRDEVSNITFCSIELTPDQLSSALSRLMHTPCKMRVRALDNVGKKHEHKKIEFEIPESLRSSSNSKELTKLSQEFVDKEMGAWKSDGHFSSQDSFFTKDDKQYARCIVRRWV